MSNITQDDQKVKQCALEECHEPIFSDNLCWGHFIEQQTAEWDAHDATRQTALESVGHIFGPALTTGEEVYHESF